MILLKLFLVFLKIGIFAFGGGYGALSLIQHEIVEKNNWMTPSEFTDIVAVSQMTPGPVGINCATYAGYTATMNYYGEGSGTLICIAGSVLSTFALILLPFLLMLAISRLVMKYSRNKQVEEMLSVLKPAVAGLILAAAILLMGKENFGSWDENSNQVICSIAIFAAVFTASFHFRTHPILLLIASGIAGYILYGCFGI